MLSRHAQLLATAMFLLDGVLIAAAWLASYWLRFFALGIPAPLGVPPLSLYLWFGAVMVPLALLVLRSLRIYRSSRTARLGEELFAVLKGTIAIVALAGLASFFTRGELSRALLAVFGGMMAVLLGGSRVLLRIVLRTLRRAGHNLRHVLIVGIGEPAQAFIRKVQGHPDYGLSVAGLVAPTAASAGESVADLPVVGSISELRSLVESRGIDLVYLALARSEWREEEAALDQLSDSTAAVRLVPDLARAFTLNSTVEDFDGMPVVRVTETPDQGWNGVLKRGFDIACSSLGLVLLSPLMLAVATWVRLDSPGPVFYGQERVGFNGRRFRMWKFRTMRLDAESTGPGWTRPGDPRRTGAGEILRKLSLDELPQLWNVLRGDMSLVGPRPPIPEEVAKYQRWQRRRLSMKPGLTCLWQISGRNDVDFDRWMQLDLEYIDSWSPMLDLKILLRTIPVVLTGKGAS
jgi:exopolysaccharide biosynthesis polyprenyl glycosylphosphotransferase